MEKISVCRKCKGTYYIKVGECDPGLCEKCETEGMENISKKEGIAIRKINELLIENPPIESQNRHIAVLLNKTEGKYIELVGLDIFEGKIVKLVDENGKKKGKHTYDEKIAELKYKDVISVPVKIVHDDKYMNVFRIVGEYELIKEKTDFIKLRDKYKHIFDHDICYSFDEVLNMDGYEEFYCLVNFTDTTLEKDKGKDKLQITLGDCFVDWLVEKGREGDGVKGVCLLKAQKNGSAKRYQLYAVKSMAKIIPKKMNKHK